MGLAASAGWLAVALAEDDGSAVPALTAYATTTSALLLWYGRHRLASMLQPDLAGLAWGLVAGAAMTAATYLLYPLLLAAEPAVASEVAELYDQLQLRGLGTALPLVLLVVAGEEILWRGALLDGIVRTRRWNRRRLAEVAVVTGVYAAAQAGFGSLLLVAVAFGCGFVWSVLRLTTGQLVAPLASHLVWSSFVLWLAPLEP